MTRVWRARGFEFYTKMQRVPGRHISLIVAALAAAAACAGPTVAPSPTPDAPPATTPGAAPTESPSPTESPAISGSPNASPTDQPSVSPTRSASATPPSGVGLELFAEGFGPLVQLDHAPGVADVVFVVEQEGRIHQGSTAGAFLPQPYLDITDRVGYGGERGLLGLAFHPGYAENGRLFVNYTDRDGTTTVSQFTREDGCECADPSSEVVLLTIQQPFPNHNGGMLAFGPDGYLYISSGDGGGGGDPLGAGQDLTTLLGKILRIDVDAATDELAYGIPADNPFADGANGARREIWDWGLRNPWRMSFDRETGDLFIGDVGQGSWEEVDAEPAGSGGRNYGWNVMEGPRCFEPRQGCDQAGLILPIASYRTGEDGTCAVTGGYVYRGGAMPALRGTYLFSDYCAGIVWGIDAATAVAGENQEPVVLTESGVNVTGFGEDDAGEVYLVTADGTVLRVVSTPR